MARSEPITSFADAMRAPCLTVRWPGLPGGEALATAADWWASLFSGAFGNVSKVVGQQHERVTALTRSLVGVKPEQHWDDHAPPAPSKRPGVPRNGFLVEVPNWDDVIQFGGQAVLDERSKRAQQIDALERLRRSPVPASVREVGEILTLVDDIQDEASTLAVALALVEKLAGRAIPGVGAVATVADALDLVNKLGRPVTGTGLPGRAGKRRVAEKARHTSNGVEAEVRGASRTPRLGVGVGALLQGAQATESLFGVGVQLGPIFGFLQDAFWGFLRGAEFRFAGPVWDPLGFAAAHRKACFRSPDVAVWGDRAYYVLANVALDLWSKVGRIMPYMDALPEPALAWSLVGLRLGEPVLRPWLQDGVWQDALPKVLALEPRVTGGVEELELRRVRADEWLARTVPGSVAALRWAILDVPDRARQAFYESLVSSWTWGMWSSLEPHAEVAGLDLRGPIRDAWIVAEYGRSPVLDLHD